jgi:hypothetical protein
LNYCDSVNHGEYLAIFDNGDYELRLYEEGTEKTRVLTCKDGRVATFHVENGKIIEEETKSSKDEHNLQVLKTEVKNQKAKVEVF